MSATPETQVIHVEYEPSPWTLVGAVVLTAIIVPASLWLMKHFGHTFRAHAGRL